mmetsp:Transcript_12002/g.22509  ORF Transcript_12002/g.22509 Transcript_12002/m.22509 type:complete len:572 (+) Transcript_12002:186-1901(+)
MVSGEGDLCSVQQELDRVAKCPLVVEETPSRGRGLVARGRIKAGQDVLVEEPYAACLFTEQLDQYCDFTFKAAPANKKLLRCSKSKVARYSSREAQAAAWKSYYKEECKAIVKCRPNLPKPTARLVARMFWKRKTAPLGWDLISRLQNHWPNFADKRKAFLAVMANEVNKLLIDTEAPSASVKEICMAMARLLCNVHTITDDELHPIGMGIYPIASLANHSCEPNCVQVYSGKQLYYKALRDIDGGEEILISYVDSCSVASERREILLQEYFFDISADDSSSGSASGSAIKSSKIFQRAIEISPAVELFKVDALQAEHVPFPESLTNEKEDPFVSIYSCVNAVQCEKVGKAFTVRRWETNSGEGRQEDFDLFSPHADDISGIAGDRVKVVCSFEEEGNLSYAATAGRLLHEVHKHILHAERSVKEQDNASGAYEEVRKVLDLCDNGRFESCQICLSKFHISRLRALRLLLDASIKVQKFDTALNVARELVDPYKLLYNKNGPVYGLHLAALAKLESYFGNLEAAVAAARESLAVLESTLPPGNATVRTMEELMNRSLMEWDALRNREEEAS